MKVLYCKKCGEFVALRIKEVRGCGCIEDRTQGAYESDGLRAWYKGSHAVPVGIDNTTFRKAHTDKSWFKAFVFHNPTDPADRFVFKKD